MRVWGRRALAYPRVNHWSAVNRGGIQKINRGGIPKIKHCVETGSFGRKSVKK